MPGRWSSVPGRQDFSSPVRPLGHMAGTVPAGRAAWRDPGPDRHAFHAQDPAPDHAAVPRRPQAGDSALETAGDRRLPASRSRTRPSARSDSASSAASTTHRPSSSRLPVACYSTGTFTAVPSRAACSPGPGPVARTGPAGPAMTRWRPTARRCTQLVTPPAGPSPGPHRPAARLRRQSAPEP